MNDQPFPSLDTPLTVTLSLHQWRGVLTWLSEGKINREGPLMAEIERQCNAQLARMTPRGNGPVLEEQATHN